MRHRSDNNQSEIVSALRKCGWTVHILSQAGNGLPDLLVGGAGENVLLETKRKGAHLTRDQKRWHSLWKGQADIVYSAEEAIEICQREFSR